MMKEKNFYGRSEEAMSNYSELIKLLYKFTDGEGKFDDVMNLVEKMFKEEIELICLLDDLEKGKKTEMKELSIPSFMQKRA